jgi:hypothetical protein
LLDLPRHDAKDRKYPSHDLDKYIRHPCDWENPDISLESHEEMFDSFKDVDECTLAGIDSLDRLRSFRFTAVHEKKIPRRMLTDRSMPMPVKTTPAGGYIYRAYMRLYIQLKKNQNRHDAHQTEPPPM